MRIDKLISELGVASRKEAANAARRGLVTVDGVPTKDLSRHIDPEVNEVVYMGERLFYREFVYIMLSKPEGYVSATEDRSLPCVTELLPRTLQARGLFPVGRLDRDTVGLMILTNDGKLAHAVLAPKREVKKLYYFKCKAPLCEDAEERFLSSVTLADGYECKSAILEADPDRLGGYITLTEGKYHQIKRMIAATDNRVTYLKRVSFAGIELDETLRAGEWRELTEDEVAMLRAAAASPDNQA